MARKSEGLHIRWRGGIAYARFTHNGVPFSESTGCRDPIAATAKAAEIYARETGSAPGRPLAVAEPSTLELAPLTALWVADLEATHDKDTAYEYDLIASKWPQRWPTLGDVTTAAIADYQRDRLREVVRGTVKKNRSYLRVFLDWCAEKGHVERVPEFPALPKRATGTRKHVRPPRIARTPQQVARLLRALPEWSAIARRSDNQRYRVRDRAIFLFETALRPATIARLVRPEHWKPGSRLLHITAEIDKARRARDVPLTPKALGALARCGGVDGLIFGVHELDDYLDAASKKAKLARVTTYDLKHSRITSWIRDGRDLAGISFLTGVDIDTLAAHYIHPDIEAAKRVLRRSA